MHLYINMNSHMYFQENPSSRLGGVAITHVFKWELKRGITLQLGARSRNGEIRVSLFSKVNIFVKFHESLLKFWCVADGSVVDGKYWAKVSKKGITDKKKDKIENPYLNAYLHINMNSHIYFHENPSRGLGEVAITNFYWWEIKRGITLQ